ncbi:MAG: D-2-hydroxyacid dehydrogenase [Oscillospiraceae bacterium]|nr:D-2-hydroxyacid dehydrogenase [Oscillospiraceae bacterium]
MRHIAVFDHFLTQAHRDQITRTAAELGFAVTYCTSVDDLPKNKRDRYEVLYGNPGPEILRLFPNLKWVCVSSAGVDRHLDDGLYPSPDVVLSNSSGAYGVTISEHVLMVALMLLRQMPVFQEAAGEHRWQGMLPTRSIFGSRVTMLGTGDIGTAVARRMKALGAACVTGVHRSDKAVDPAFDRAITFRELDEVLPETDILVSALPHTAETAGTLSRERIGLLPRDAILINVGRGTVLDQEALMDALRGGRLAGAALDVMVPEPLPAGHPLWNTPNLLITPHISGNMSLGYTCDVDVDFFCQDLARFAQGLPLLRAVDRKRGY